MPKPPEELIIPNEATKLLHITGLKRPYTPRELIEMLKSISDFDDKNNFWLSKNKSECVINYNTIEDCVIAYNKLYNLIYIEMVNHGQLLQ